MVTTPHPWFDPPFLPDRISVEGFSAIVARRVEVFGGAVLEAVGSPLFLLSRRTFCQNFCLLLTFVFPLLSGGCARRFFFAAGRFIGGSSPLPSSLSDGSLFFPMVFPAPSTCCWIFFVSSFSDKGVVVVFVTGGAFITGGHVLPGASSCSILWAPCAGPGDAGGDGPGDGIGD